MEAAPAPAYPATLELQPGEHIANWRPLVHWLLIIPHAIVLNVIGVVAGVVSFIAWFVILFTGKLPEGMAGLMALYIRYYNRVYGYELFMREEYPPFSFETTEQDPGDYPPVRHALVRANPRNGRKNLFIGSHAWRIEGLGIDESRILLAKLLEVTVRPEHVYRHRWQVRDLVMWDNRCALHRGRPWDSGRHRRVMHRTTVAGDGPTADPPYLHDLATR